MIRKDKNLSRYCSEPLENIENYGKAIADDKHMWDCHHRAEILPCGSYSREDLKKVGMYWKRPASELIFLRHDAHRRLHNKGKKASQDTLRKMSESHKGKNVSQDTRRKLSAIQINRPDESTPVEMTRIADGFVKVFPSQMEAARYLANHDYSTHQSSICNCCKGKRKTAYGCRWRYV